jgi:mannose-6-phosphate isomerase
VLLEWDGFGIADEDEATLGLGWDVALGAVETDARDAAALRGPGRGDGEPVARLLPAAADPFFRADRLAPAPIAALERGFAILIAIEGEGALLPESGEALTVRRGDAVLVPWAAGVCHLEGDLVAIACRPPAVSERGAR